MSLSQAWHRTFKFRVAFNMLWCALLFGWFGSLPRETISGFVGRKARNEYAYFWHILEWFIDWMHVKERNHCLRVAMEEDAGFRVLYPERYRC